MVLRLTSGCSLTAFTWDLSRMVFVIKCCQCYLWHLLSLRTVFNFWPDKLVKQVKLRQVEHHLGQLQPVCRDATNTPLEIPKRNAHGLFIVFSTLITMQQVLIIYTFRSCPLYFTVSVSLQCKPPSTLRNLLEQSKKSQMQTIPEVLFKKQTHLAPVKTFLVLSDVTLDMRFQLSAQKQKLFLRARNKIQKATLTPCAEM